MTKHSKRYGPSFTPNQSVNYDLVDTCYSYGADVRDSDGKLRNSNDYIWVSNVSGVDYYCPNDEDWGAIIAMDHKRRLAVDTGFYEMDDIEAPHGEYKLVIHNGELMAAFSLDN